MTNKVKRAQEPSIALDPSRLWTFEEARYYLRIGESTLRSYLKCGRLPAVRVGGDTGRLLLFKKADLDALLVPVESGSVDEARRKVREKKMREAESEKETGEEAGREKDA